MTPRRERTRLNDIGPPFGWRAGAASAAIPALVNSAEQYIGVGFFYDVAHHKRVLILIRRTKRSAPKSLGNRK